jgi:SEC-C motif
MIGSVRMPAFVLDLRTREVKRVARVAVRRASQRVEELVRLLGRRDPVPALLVARRHLQAPHRVGYQVGPSRRTGPAVDRAERRHEHLQRITRKRPCSSLPRCSSSTSVVPRSDGSGDQHLAGCPRPNLVDPASRGCVSAPGREQARLVEDGQPPSHRHEYGTCPATTCRGGAAGASAPRCPRRPVTYASGAVTLLLSVVTPRYVMQASDRRVVSLSDSGSVIDADDEQNKAIFVAERMTFAYTGHARIDREDTAEFFQGVMARSLATGRSVEDSLATVGTMSAGYFRSLRADTDRHHSFVGVGWEGRPPHDGPPFIAWTSNAIDENGERLSAPQEQFATHYRRLAAGEAFALVTAGAVLPEDALSRLNAQLAFLTGDGDDPAAVGLVLVEAIREQAAENDAVGSGVMINCIPRSPGPPGGDIIFVGDAPKLDVRTFAYVPADAVPAYEYLGPLVVTSDGHRMADFIATPPGPQGAQGFVYRPSWAPPRPRAAAGQRVRDYRIGRNDLCWCGSGKKYKKCHAP